MQNQFEHVLIYEDADLKRKALKHIPVNRLREEAQSKYENYKKLPNLDKNPYEIDDFILLELLAWFKNEFFSWVNQAECEFCHNKNTVFLMNDRPNHNELSWMANNVEVYLYEI